MPIPKRSTRSLDKSMPSNIFWVALVSLQCVNMLSMPVAWYEPPFNDIRAFIRMSSSSVRTVNTNSSETATGSVMHRAVNEHDEVPEVVTAEPKPTSTAVGTLQAGTLNMSKYESLVAAMSILSFRAIAPSLPNLFKGANLKRVVTPLAIVSAWLSTNANGCD